MNLKEIIIRTLWTTGFFIIFILHDKNYIDVMTVPISIFYGVAWGISFMSSKQKEVDK